LERLDEEILTLQNLREQQIRDIADIDQQLDALDRRAAGSTGIRNYFEKFEWSERMREQMRNVFGIENFRLAQEGCVIIFCYFLPPSFPAEQARRGGNFEYFSSTMRTVCATRTWMDEISFVSCQLVSSAFSHILLPVFDYCIMKIVCVCFRGREIAHLSTACDTGARVHAGYFASCIAHEGSDSSSAREQQSVKKKNSKEIVG
jgi:hypothetical protein